MIPTLYDFVQGITSDNLSNDVSHHFDQVMALYHVIGGRSDVDICTDHINGKFGFSLLMESKDDAVTLNEQLDNTSFVSYGRSYLISSERKKDTLTVRFLKD